MLQKNRRSHHDPVGNSEYARRQVLSNITGIALDIIECIQNKIRRNVIVLHFSTLEETVERFWHDVQIGAIEVESMALLRAIRTIMCRDLGRQLRQPYFNQNKVLREIRLLINTVQHIIVPDTPVQRKQYHNLSHSFL
ncbi:MAG: hypothetical protein ACXAB6_02580 [Candidatus Thorarchaeota archaeon]|jgi:hypothetical protein